jgi:hypothetical protein
MAKAKTRKLKVFQAQFGFHDSVVAASSKAAALRAWGTHQNLFADGQASIATDEAAVKAALAHPAIPLLRAVGSNDAFELKATSLPKVPDEPKRVPAKAAPIKRKADAAVAPSADRSKLDAAELAVRELDEARKREEARLRRKQEELETEVSEAQSAYVEHRKEATAALIDARKAFREVGGRE